MKIAYVNGRYLPMNEAYVHIEDRGYQFADGVYEVIAVRNGGLLDGKPHLERLSRSLAGLEIAPPLSSRALELVISELIARNRTREGTLYMQVTRGVAKRDHPFPRATKASLVMNTTGPKNPKPHEIGNGVKIITVPETRWARRDIKSIALLPNVLAKQEAVRAGVREAWFVENGFITEGSSTNAYMVTAKNEIITHPANNSILAGVTRAATLKLAGKAGIKIIEKPFSLKELMGAKEAFLTSTTAGVLCVVEVNGKKIGKGAPGEIGRTLRGLYESYAEKNS